MAAVEAVMAAVVVAMVEVEEEEEDMAEVVMAVEDIEWVLVDLTIELDQHSLLPNE